MHIYYISHIFSINIIQSIHDGQPISTSLGRHAADPLLYLESLRLLACSVQVQRPQGTKQTWNIQASTDRTGRQEQAGTQGTSRHGAGNRQAAGKKRAGR